MTRRKQRRVDPLGVYLDNLDYKNLGKDSPPPPLPPLQTGSRKRFKYRQPERALIRWWHLFLGVRYEDQVPTIAARLGRTPSEIKVQLRIVCEFCLEEGRCDWGPKGKRPVVRRVRRSEVPGMKGPRQRRSGAELELIKRMCEAGHDNATIAEEVCRLYRPTMTSKIVYAVIRRHNFKRGVAQPPSQAVAGAIEVIDKETGKLVKFPDLKTYLEAKKAGGI